MSNVNHNEKVVLRRVDQMHRIQFPTVIVLAFNLKARQIFEVYLEGESIVCKPCNNCSNPTPGTLSVFRCMDDQRRIRIPIRFYRTLLAKEGTPFKLELDYERQVMVLTKYREFREVSTISKYVSAGFADTMDKPVFITDGEMVIGGSNTGDRTHYHGLRLSPELIEYIKDDNLDPDILNTPDLEIAKEIPFEIDFMYPIYGHYALLGTIIVLKERGEPRTEDMDKFFYAVKTVSKIIQLEMTERENKKNGKQ